MMLSLSPVPDMITLRYREPLTEEELNERLIAAALRLGRGRHCFMVHVLARVERVDAVKDVEIWNTYTSTVDVP